jgi:hypothetical protein
MNRIIMLILSKKGGARRDCGYLSDDTVIRQDKLPDGQAVFLAAVRRMAGES